MGGGGEWREAQGAQMPKEQSSGRIKTSTKKALGSRKTRLAFGWGWWGAPGDTWIHGFVDVSGLWRCLQGILEALRWPVSSSLRFLHVACIKPSSASGSWTSGSSICWEVAHLEFTKGRASLGTLQLWHKAMSIQDHAHATQ